MVCENFQKGCIGISKLIAYSTIGGRDLFHGVPNINGAFVRECSSIDDGDYYITVITLIKENGAEFQLEIRQEK